jgi:hypothetical protein
MNEIVNLRHIPISGANAADLDDASNHITTLIADFCDTQSDRFLDLETPLIGVMANVRENTPVGSIRMDLLSEIRWRLAEMKNEQFKMLADLRSDLVGKIEAIRDEGL